MTTKQYLGQIERLDRMISNKTIEIQQVENQLYNIKSIMNDCKVQTSGSKDRLGDSVSKLVDLQNELSNLIDSYVAKRQEIIKIIEKVRETNRYDLLFKKYVEQKSFEQIACEMNYSLVHIKRIHKLALDEVNCIIKR
mgnify:CR=1 FL=1